MEKGTVYFFTGLSGAGKTTVGGMFYQRLKAAKPNVVLLDGDGIRPIFGEDAGYSHADRLKWAYRIFRVCKMLADQGIDVVVCSIAMYEQVRRWNREHIESYQEIYIKVQKETLVQRNQKGLYTAGRNVVGLDLPFDEPQNPDVIIENDGDEEPIRIVEYLERKLHPYGIQDSVNHSAYWNQYYRDHLCPEEPSCFAKYVASLVEPGRTLLELGCGNGRDAVYFASHGLSVRAMDLSETAIEELRGRKIPHAEFICGDFVRQEAHRPNSYDYAYSRFTIHSISHQQEQLLLTHVFQGLKDGGKFFIEVRGVHDPLFGKGKLVERNAYFYDAHYRRFIVMDELVNALTDRGFHVEYAEEQTGFAPYGTDDPPVIRIVAVKPTAKLDEN